MTFALAPRTETPEVERLRRFCRTVLETLDGHGPPLPVLMELSHAIGAGVESVAEGVRAEADALESTLHQLKNLPSRYLTSLPAVASLVAELEAAHERANLIRRAFDAFSPSQEPAASIETFELQQEPKAESRTQRAARIFREGELEQKERRFEAAERLYSQSIEIDPRFGPARSRRGQVRLALNRVEDAMADFTEAIELDDSAAEAWWWRADAKAVAGRIDDAIADYERALELRPDLGRARFNLAVALKRKDEAKPPPAIAPQRISPPPRTNLGGTGLQTGVAGGTGLQTGVAGGTGLQTGVAGGTGLQTGVATPEKKIGHLAVRCPHCSESGEVPWDRLGKIFACKACKKHFGVGSDGTAVGLVEVPGGKWIEIGKARIEVRRRRKKRIAIVGLVCLVLLVPTLAIAGWKTSQGSPSSGEAELPGDLHARAEVFAKAWLSGDVRTMKRLTSPALERNVFAWFNRHRPPAASLAEGTQIEAVVKPGRAGQSAVRIRIANPKQADQPPAELSMVWEERENGWFFLPPAR